MLAKAQAGAYDEAAVKAKLQATITSAPVVIFSFRCCVLLLLLLFLWVGLCSCGRRRRRCCCICFPLCSACRACLTRNDPLLSPIQFDSCRASTCPFCKRAKALLESLGARYTALELNEMGPEGLQLRAELAEVRSRREAGDGRWAVRAASCAGAQEQLLRCL